jgi:hypothetical protein
MDSHQVNFRGYLHGEVENAEKLYSQARDQFFGLTSGPQVEPSPHLLAATEVLFETTKVYICALRRLAHYSAHNSARNSSAEGTRQMAGGA